MNLVLNAKLSMQFSPISVCSYHRHYRILCVFSYCSNYSDYSASAYPRMRCFARSCRSSLLESTWVTLSWYYWFALDLASGCFAFPVVWGHFVSDTHTLCFEVSIKLGRDFSFRFAYLYYCNLMLVHYKLIFLYSQQIAMAFFLCCDVIGLRGAADDHFTR